MKKIDITALVVSFKKIKGNSNINNDFLFKQIKFAIQLSDKNFYTLEDIKALCVMEVLKKCEWLNLENNSDFQNVNEFMNIFFQELVKKPAFITNDKEFYRLSSVIIALSK